MILSIENHCSIKQQQAMAHYLKTLLGDKLYTDNVDTSLNGMPSPEALKGKILVKVCSILSSLYNRCAEREEYNQRNTFPTVGNIPN